MNKKIVWIVSAVLVMLPIGQIVGVRSEAASSLMFGLSLSRLILVFGIFIIGLFCAGMALFGDRLEKKFPRWAGSSPERVLSRFNFVFIGAISFIWLGFAPHAFEDWQEFYIRLRPVIQYLAIVFGLWTIYYSIGFVKQNRFSLKVGIKTAFPPLLLFIVFLLVWVFVRTTGIGITPGYPYWGEAGTILFGYQFILSLVAAWSVASFFKRLLERHPVGFDVAVFILLWVAAGVLWNLADMGHNFFAPRAFGQDYFPYSDAATYDVNAYSILIGKGITFAQYTYRPMYIGFLALLHFFSGPNYSMLVALQVGVLALIVPGIYLVGREIHSRTLGFLVGFMGIVSQLNSFAANEFVRVSNSKLLLTEFPTAVILVYTAFFFISGVKRNSQKQVLVAFGLLATAFLIRLHVAVVFVALLLMLVLIYSKPKVWLRNTFSILGMVFLIVLPWMLRNSVAVGSFSLDPGRFDLILEERWKDDQEGKEGKWLPPPVSSKMYKLLVPLSENTSQEINAGVNSINEMLAHFLHNEVLSVMGLPNSVGFLTGRNYYQNEYKLSSQWSGELNTSGKLYVAGNLFILAVGIWSAYKKEQWLGLSPLLIHFSYNAANALVRTSGWRYLTPTEWVPMLYYGMGLLQILFVLRVLAGSTAADDPAKRFRDQKLSLISMGNLLKAGSWFVVLSMIVSFAPLFIPDKFPELTSDARQVYLEEITNNSDLTEEQLETFLSSNQAVLLVGKVLYPRNYYADEGIFHYRSEVVDYPRLEFTLIEDYSRKIRFAINRSKIDIQHEMDVLVLGCRSRNGYIEAQLVFPLGESVASLYLRSTGWEEACPLSAP